ncbi:unnamed protein product [Ceutorhynchus assimilis]|uniref:NADH dehydrogenase [ubiquinone] iron-sulfur protein 4, mitochondrial n=1 Tax=Ceutorhynchus assimilis TaxID=467358 RepID=A0A9N9QKP2_9CUCU|nr:unnamed protein product [Ceutorhynchus assimilis]
MSPGLINHCPSSLSILLYGTIEVQFFSPNFPGTMPSEIPPVENGDYLPEPEIKHLEDAEGYKCRLLRTCKIVLRVPDDFSLVRKVPIEIHCNRSARIHQPTKNAQQQGTRHLGHWEIDFDTKERWENATMGWCSSGDPVSNVKMPFSTKEQAIDYCKKNQIRYWVQNEKRHKKFKVRSYALNFHHNSKARLSTK